MDLFRRGELGLLGGGEGLRDDVGVSGISWSANRLPEDMYPASGLALAAAYHDIKTRLASLERENSSIKRKLKHYEVKVESSTYTNTQTVHRLSHRIEHKGIKKTHGKDVNALFTGESIFSHFLPSPVLQFPMISEFGEERILCCSCEPIIKDTSVIQSETTNLQQRINSLTQEVLCNISSVVMAEICRYGITVECRDNISKSQTTRHQADCLARLLRSHQREHNFTVAIDPSCTAVAAAEENKRLGV